MAFNVLDPTSIIVDSIVLLILSILFITSTAVTAVEGTSVDVGTLFNVAAILTILACAYGIPISKVRKGYARRFAITASVFAALGFVIATINIILRLMFMRRRSSESAAWSVFGMILAIVVDIAATLLASKYTKTSILLTREERAQSTQVPPHVMAVQPNVHGSYYPTQPAAQPMMVGPPGYRPS